MRCRRALFCLDIDDAGSSKACCVFMTWQIDAGHNAALSWPPNGVWCGSISGPHMCLNHEEMGRKRSQVDWGIRRTFAVPRNTRGADRRICSQQRGAFARDSAGTLGVVREMKPLALVLQREYIAEEEPEQYVHVKEDRITEWPVAFLSRPRLTENTIPDFLSPSAPSNRLDIVRGLAK